MEIVAVDDQKKATGAARVVAGTSAVTLVGGGALRPVRSARGAGACAGSGGGRQRGGLRKRGGPDTPRPSSAISTPSRTAVRARLPVDIFHEISEQDSTDFDKALRHLAVPLVLAVGFTGARLDHELAVFHSLVTRSGHRCIVIGERDVVFHAPLRLGVDLPPGTRVSLFPMGPVTGRSRGLRWPIDGLVLSSRPPDRNLKRGDR